MYKLKKGGVLLYNVVAKNEVLEDEPAIATDEITSCPHAPNLPR